MNETNGVHTCTYYCDRPACIKRQRDDLRGQLEARQAASGQTGACAPVPLPGYDINTASHMHARIRGYTDRAMRAYGEACAAHLREIALRAADQAQQLKIAMKSAERERDECKARAEAAEAKIAEMEGATPERRA